jgi:hypothetical protein
MNEEKLIPEEREVLDTRSMLEEGFMKNLRGVITNAAASTKSKIDSKMTSVASDISTEKLLQALYEIRDGLIDAMRDVNVASPVANSLTTYINKMGSCIKHLGGPVEAFDPLNHVSGLKVPNLLRNAERVIETTKQCYSLGSIENAHINDDNTKISLVFAGKSGSTEYRAKGVVISSCWTGNEAVDYIYTPGSGKMSVKVFASGKWIDKSSDYKVSWELEENDIDSKQEAQKESNNSGEIIKEAVQPSGNNTEDKDIGDFPVEEK